MADRRVILDRHGQPLALGLNWHRNLRKSAESLIGICQGLLADGELSERDIVFLSTWLRENPDIADGWPGYVVRDWLEVILEDGVITPAEAANLKDVITSMVGGTLDETGAVSGMATRLPVDAITAMPVAGRSFCFTGKFLFGSRAACSAAVEGMGGVVVPDVRKSLDYLIIGAMSSRDWAYSSHGRKIEKAVGYRDRGAPLRILSEEVWTEHLHQTPAPSDAPTADVRKPKRKSAVASLVWMITAK